MSQASTNAFITGTKSGKFKSLKAKILSLIKERPNEMSIEKTCAILDKKPNEVSGRFSELTDKGLIYVSRRYDNNHRSIYDFEPNEIQQVYNSLKRGSERYDKWKKNGEKHNYFKRHQLLNQLR